MITTYTELQTAVANWINRDDLTDRIPEFIALAEGHFNRKLRRPEMENSATTTLDSESVTLPTDFLAARSMFLNRNPRLELDYVPHGTLRTQYASTASGIPAVYTIADGAFVFGPAPGDAYELDMVYWQRIPALASNATNWLLTSHPDLYLYGSLMHAAIYIRDDSATAAYTTLTEGLLGEMAKEGVNRAAGASPLVARPRNITWRQASGKGVW